MKLISMLSVVVLFTVGSMTVFAQKPETGPAKETKTETRTPAVSSEKITIKTKVTKKDYTDLLAELKKGNTSINFAKIRLAFTETDEYSPYGGSEYRRPMYAAFGKKDDKAALAEAANGLKANYMDPAVHFISWKSNETLGNAKDAEFHKKVFEGLMAAITENDGLSEKTGMISIGIAEQYFVMDYLGYRQQGKALVNKDGSMFDVHTAVKLDSDETRKFYFNIDKVFGKF